MRVKLFIWYLLFFNGAIAQTWTLENRIELKNPISSYAIDQQSDIYLGTNQGNIYRYSSSGKEDMHFSDIGNSSITTTDAWNRLKLFLFFRDLQQFTFLDRFTTTPVTYDIRNFQSDLAWLVAPGIDNSIWMLTPTYNELRKFNIQTKELILTTPLGIDLQNASYMRNYQNLTIICDPDKGLYFFDQYGNLLYQLHVTGISYFYIRKRNIVALSGEGILKINPFSPESYETIKAPEGAFNGVLTNGELYFFIQETSVSIYRMEL